MKLKLSILLFLFGLSFTSPAGFNNALKTEVSTSISDIYSKIDWGQNQLQYEIFEKAITGYNTLKLESRLTLENQTISIIDYSLPSGKKRLWVVDLIESRVLFNTLVSHGKNTGSNYSENFSNVPQSHKSSLGFFITGATYHGKHGLSLHLDGIEKGINDKARARHIVIHGANYVNKNFVKAHGRLGRSHGCPAIPEHLSDDIIKTIANKTCLFSYYPSKKYFANSIYMN